ncbi:PREDICTED: 3-hydroxy-3-methylglutaryl-coenzyme A reductase-like [Acropora digitifera]|uniref:3-hydroxy-3-methylglutaryl-coenzyme A reductase-like n=1 Tax=Acropora digitifera TaxID=70779 RepID=UPI000779FBF8|nr:PREDICTED: 3-hydroxy-3-methylglutaryl-coenzyme A reductase-like [Acropora digitifera]
MTFLPACLSLFLELCTGRGQGNPRWQIPSKGLPAEDLEPNPVVQGVKLIMSTGLMLVHMHRWFLLRSENYEGSHGMSSYVEDRWFRRFLAENTEQVGSNGRSFQLSETVEARRDFLYKLIHVYVPFEVTTDVES